MLTQLLALAYKDLYFYNSSVVVFQYMRDSGMDDVSAIEDYQYLSAADHYNEAEPESRYVHGISGCFA